MYNVGEEISLKLMKRERGSLLPVPVEQSDQKNITGLLSLTETEIDTIYSKLLLANADDVKSIIDVEKSELLSSLKENEGCPEMCFVEQALELLKEREDFLLKSVCNDYDNVVSNNKESESQSSTSRNSDSAVDYELPQDIHSLKIDDNHERKRYESVGSEGCCGCEDDHSFPYEDLEITTSQQISKPSYFYQGIHDWFLLIFNSNIRTIK